MLISGLPDDLVTTVACIGIALVITVGVLARDRGAAMLRVVAWNATLAVAVVLLVPAPWNLVAYVALLVVVVSVRLRRNAGRVGQVDVSVGERPEVPGRVDQLIADFRALDFDEPVFLRFDVEGHPAHRADLVDRSRTARATVLFVSSLQRPQRITVGSRFAAGALVTSDRGVGTPDPDTLLQVVELGTAEQLVEAHERALALIGERGLLPTTLDAEPDVAKVQADLRASVTGRASVGQTWRMVWRSRQSGTRIEHPDPPVRSPKDERVTALVTRQPAASGDVLPEP